MSALTADALRFPGARSVFYGTSLTQNGGWVDALAAEIRALNPGFTWVNAAEGGRESRWGRTHFTERVIAEKPDVVFLEFAINDAVARFALPVDEARANLEAMLDALRAARPQCVPVLQVMNPVTGRPAGHDGHRPHLAQHEAMWRTVARERHLSLIDHAPAWAALLARGENEFLRFVPDGLHPSLEGYRRHMLPALRAALGLPDPGRIS